MDVTFKCTGEAGFTMEVDFFDTVDDIKRKLQGQRGWPAASLSLSHGGRALAGDADGSAAEQYGIVEGSVVQVALAGDGYEEEEDDGDAALLVNAVLYNGGAVRGRLEVAVRPSAAVSALRGELEQARAAGELPALPRGGEYFFIHGQSVMKEQMSFAWHGVVAGDEVSVYPGSLISDPNHNY